jgi:hypothetical protein
MASPVDFEGTNRLLRSDDDRVADLPAFGNGACLVTCWELDDQELHEVIRTGRIYLASFCGDVIVPVFVGAEGVTRGVVADYGRVWPRSNLNMPEGK